jgi:Ni,Fe-hydrogenase I cytochrome b subunit
MKTTKLIIGIISIVLSAFIIFQSFAAGIGNAIAGSGETSGSSGLFLAVCMLIAGIVGIATRTGLAGGFVAAGFYLLGGLIGIVNYGSFSDLLIWSILCFILAAVYLISGILIRNKEKNVMPKVAEKGAK